MYLQFQQHSCLIHINRRFFVRLTDIYSMKSLLLLLLFFVFHSSNAQFTSSVYWTEQTTLVPADVVYYNKERPLAWKDFKGTAQESSIASAMTASGFGYKADVKNNGSKGQIIIGVYCFFNKNSSWVKAGKTTGYILSHEQNHFSISYIAACYFIEKLKATEISSVNYNTILAKLYKESCDYMNKMQQDYDGQTKNGQLKDIQAKWDQFVSNKVNSITK
jgi:hypothetical protein